MSAVIDSVLDLSKPLEAASELARLNDALACERTIPAHVAEGVHALAVALTEADVARWDAADPHLALVLHRATIEAQEALDDPDEPRGRDRLRVALEAARQALAALAEAEPVGPERPPKEIIQWLVDATRDEVPQNRVADLLDVSLRQFQRWASPRAPTGPEGEDARRARAVTLIVNQLRFSLTPAGAIAWFDWRNEHLRRKRPRDLLADPKRLPELTAAAASMRSTLAG